MNAGQTNVKVGTRVRLKDIGGEDKKLNGLLGTLTHPFAFGETKKGWVGFILEEGQNSAYGEKFNIRLSECEIL